MNVGDIKAKYIWLVVISIIVPFIISLAAIYLIFGNYVEAFNRLIELKGNPNSTADAVISLSYIITILISVYGILATSIFSYLVWRVSVGSYAVSNDLKKLEEFRDEEITREQALIIYYDLNRGFLYVQDLYISTILNKSAPNPRRLHFSGEWIKNVASLRTGLNNEELNNVYHLYDKLLTLQSLVNDHFRHEEVASEEISSFVKEVSKEIFADYIPLELLGEFRTSSAEDLLKLELYITLQKIYLLTFNKKHITKEKDQDNFEVYYCNKSPYYKVEDGEMFSGKGTLYNSKGKEKASGEFFNSFFTTGRVYGYFDSLEKQYYVEYQTSNPEREIVKSEIKDLTGKGKSNYFFKGKYLKNQLINGITTLFHSEGSIKYRGEVIQGEKHGDGIFYSEKGEIVFEGEYKENLRHKGTLFQNKLVKFEGLFKNGQPWEGQVKDYDFRKEFISKFTGIINKGEPYSGSGYRFKRNNFNETLDYLLHEEYYEPRDNEDDLREDYEQKLINEHTREEYTSWEDYIFTMWEEGDATEAEENEGNIIVYYNESSRKDK